MQLDNLVFLINNQNSPKIFLNPKFSKDVRNWIGVFWNMIDKAFISYNTV